MARGGLPGDIHLERRKPLRTVPVTVPQRDPQRAQHQVGDVGGSCVPAHDPLGEDVEDEGDVDEPGGMRARTLLSRAARDSSPHAPHGTARESSTVRRYMLTHTHVAVAEAPADRTRSPASAAGDRRLVPRVLMNRG